MEPLVICFEKRRISNTHWSIIHEEDTYCNLKPLPAKENASLQDLENQLVGLGDPYIFFIVADKETAKNESYLIVERENLNIFRCDVDSLFGVYANLSLCDMDYEDFADRCNADGIFVDF